MNLDTFKDFKKIRRQIDEILSGSSRDMKPRDKKNVVVKIAYNHLLANGKFYYDSVRQEGYWFDSESKQLWIIVSQKI